MKNFTKIVSIVVLLALTITLVPAPTFAQDTACESDVIVQADDWLSKIADKVYGDVLAFPAIVDATNAIAATDDSYATIANPDIIEPGWKLCIPAGGEAVALLEVSSGTDWFAQAAQPYAGVTIRGISESTPPSNYSQEVLAAAFEKETGINVEFETTSWDQMYAKPIQDMEANTGIYDFIYIEQDIIYTYLAREFLTDLTQLLAENPELKAPSFDEAKFTSFIDNFRGDGGDLYGVPMEAFVKIMLYRKDLFENPEIQAAFEAEYGYPLAPATTHQQYRDNAAFFTKYGQENGLELWGTTVQGNTGHASSFYEFFETIAPSYGLYNWGIKDLGGSNYKACVASGGEMNSDLAKEALQFWVDMLQYAPPEATSSTWDEVAATFAAGRAAQGWVYGENAAWIATDATRSQVVGNVGVALPPTSEGVLDAAASGAGYIGYYDGGAFGIPYSSKNKEATLLWLQYIGQESVQPQWATAGSRIVMDSTFEDALVKAQDARTDNYYTLMKEQGPLFKGAPPFPFHPQAQTTAQTYIWQALTGDSTPSDALDQACAAVEEELGRLGYSQ
ncbi:MAG: extracellular solute-binding protein [Anaerolineae bacterium]|nr:extracellular solute-binding protein [Anaerolineae bacterium]